MLKQDDLFDDEIFTLTDDETGKETDFSLLGSVTLEGTLYLALTPVDEGENPDDSYVILKAELDEKGDDVLSTIDDDEEFDRVAGIFDDQLFGDEDEGEDEEDDEEDGDTSDAGE